MADIILALKPKWLELILSGKKTAEFRRAMPKYIAPGDKIYLYNNRALHGVAKLRQKNTGIGKSYWAPNGAHQRMYYGCCVSLAALFAEAACLPESEAFRYLYDGQRPGALQLCNVHRFASPVAWNGPVVQNYIYAPPYLNQKLQNVYM